MNNTSLRSFRLLPFPTQRLRCCIALILCMFALGACSPKQPDPYSGSQETVWRYGPGEIVLNVKSTSDLNRYRDKPHTVALCVYQLSSESGFNELMRNEAGLDQLVQCGRFDPSVVHYEQSFIPPDSSRTLTLNRHEGVKFLALVAGYYESTPSGSTRVVRIPVVEVSDSWVPLVGGSRREAGRLNLDVILERVSIHTVATKR